jgi:hypothetical protein
VISHTLFPHLDTTLEVAAGVKGSDPDVHLVGTFEIRMSP